ncbi:unnamed protein product [Rotaria magnacalcarata]|nr:unnamed protein product [Rotaria magnacalcarata]
MSSISTAKVLDICQLGEPIKTIERIRNSGYVLVASEQYLIIYNASNLCFLDSKLKVVRQTEWTHGAILDICWNTKFHKIYMIVGAQVFFMDSETMKCEKLFEEKLYNTCTCSDDILYLSTCHEIQQVLAHSCSDLLSVKCVFNCQKNKCIDGMAYHNGKLALVMNGPAGTKPYVEILSTTTYACLFSITITNAYGFNQCRISSLGSNGWLMKDPGTCHIHHVTENNIVRTTPTYNYGYSQNAIGFGADYLVVSTDTSYNLHRLKYVPMNELTPSEVCQEFCRVS